MFMAVWSVQAQQIESQNVPPLVIQSFNKLYPDVVHVKYELEDGNYEAKFKKDDSKLEAVFSATGTLIQTEKSLGSVKDLPIKVLNTLKKDFAGYTYKDAEVLTTADGKVLYEVEAESASVAYELLYDSEGNLMKKTLSEEESKKKK